MTFRFALEAVLKRLIHTRPEGCIAHLQALGIAGFGIFTGDVAQLILTIGSCGIDHFGNLFGSREAGCPLRIGKGVHDLPNQCVVRLLAAFDIAQASPQELAAQREALEAPWNDWHLVRTVAAVMALGFTLAAAFSGKIITKPFFF